MGRHDADAFLQASESAGVQLRDARFINPQSLSDFFHGEGLVVIKANNGAVTLAEGVERAANHRLLLAPIAGLKRVSGLGTGQAGAQGGTILLRLVQRGFSGAVGDLDLALELVPFLQRHAQFLSHVRAGRLAPQAGLTSGRRFRHLMRLAPHVARGRIASPQRVQNRAANAVTSVTLNLHVAARVKLAERIQQSQHALMDQIAELDLGRQVTPHLRGHLTNQGQQRQNEGIGSLRGGGDAGASIEKLSGRFSLSGARNRSRSSRATFSGRASCDGKL